jgi:WD40 repeat protein
LAASGRDGALTLWDGKTGKELRKLVAPLPPKSSEFEYLGRVIENVLFIPDGTVFGAGGFKFGIRSWDASSGQEKLKIEDAEEPIAISPDQKTLACSKRDDHSILLVNIATGESSLSLLGHKQSLTSVQFSPDGKTLISGSHDGTLRFWDTSSGKEIHRIGEERIESAIGPPFPHCIRFSPDGSVVAVSHHGCFELGLDLLDPVTKKKITSLTAKHSDALAFSPSGSFLAYQGEGERIEIWGVKEGRRIAISPKPGLGRLFGMAFSSDGHKLASADQGGVIFVWDTSKLTLK